MKLHHAVVVSAVTLLSAAAIAQTAKPADEIKYRQSAMTVVARSFGALNGMASGKVPFDQAVAEKNALVVGNLTPLIGVAFGPGTESGAPTKADPKIWTEGDKFKAAYDKFVAETAKLPAAAKDVAALKTQVAEVGKTCKGCHDDYRMKEARN